MKKILLVLVILSAAFASCKDDNGKESTTSTLNLNITGLSDLGADYVYEGWLLVNGTPKTTGTFTVDANGGLSATDFQIDNTDLTTATKFILTIEPASDSDPAPSAVHILAGDFSGNSAVVSVGDMAALGNDFTASTGKYILATPTNGAETDENSGVWWLNPTAGPGVGLDLPMLPAGWKYEGWAVIGGTPVTTGKFSAVDVVDDAAPFSSTMSGPPFPGEDFLVNAPSGVTFPTDLSGATIVISVEPDPDNGSGPFLLKPLVGMVPADATDHTAYEMNNNAANTNPSGTVKR